MPEDLSPDPSPEVARDGLPAVGDADAASTGSSPPGAVTHHGPRARGRRRTAVIAIAALGVAATGGAIAVASTHSSHGVARAGVQGIAAAETSTAPAESSASGESGSRSGGAPTGTSGSGGGTTSSTSANSTTASPLGQALHGTFTVSDSTTEELMQTGSVTAVSAGSLTVTSKDGFIRTYMLDKATSYNGGRGAQTDVTKGTTVTVLAPDTATLTAADVDNHGAQSPPNGATGVAPSTAPTSSGSGAPTTVSGGGGKPPAGAGPGGSGSGGTGPGSGSTTESGSAPSGSAPSGAPTALPIRGNSTGSGTSTSGTTSGTAATAGTPGGPLSGAGPGSGTAGLLADIEYGTFVVADGTTYITDSVVVGTVETLSSSAITIEAKNGTSKTFALGAATQKKGSLTTGATVTVVADADGDATYAVAGSGASQSGLSISGPAGAGPGAAPAATSE